MKKIYLFSALALILLTSACGGEQGETPTLSGTILPAAETSTPLGGLAVTTTETATTSATETAAPGSETPTLSSTESVSALATAIVGSPAAGTTQTPGIPVTGLDITLVDCQFCVDTLAHALLVLPDTATFEVVAPKASDTGSATNTAVNTNCSTIEVNNGKQVVLCSGPENTPVTLNICINANTCTNFPVNLLACPLTSQSGTALPSKPQSVPGTGTESATPAAGLSTTTSTTATTTMTP